MMDTAALLQIGSAGCAFVAAGLWWWSALGDAPPMTFDRIEDVQGWLNQAAQRNRWAAGFAGLSALLAGIATLLG